MTDALRFLQALMGVGLRAKGASGRSRTARAEDRAGGCPRLGVRPLGVIWCSWLRGELLGEQAAVAAAEIVRIVKFVYPEVGGA